MVHQPGHPQPPRRLHHEPILRGTQGPRGHLPGTFQQVHWSALSVVPTAGFLPGLSLLLVAVLRCGHLFRCVLNWFGDWSTEALYQVGKEFTSKMDLEKPNYIVPDYMPVVYDKLPQPPSHREAIVNSCVFVHQTLHQVGSVLRSGKAKVTVVLK